MKKRIPYFIAMLVCGILGFTLRYFSAYLPYIVATYMPDILWACMIYWLVATIFAKKPALHFVIALIITLGIEFSQLLNFSWLTAIRGTPIGAYILGIGFLISDVLSYAGAVILCFILDLLACNKKPKVRQSKYRK